MEECPKKLTLERLTPEQSSKESECAMQVNGEEQPRETEQQVKHIEETYRGGLRPGQEASVTEMEWVKGGVTENESREVARAGHVGLYRLW